MESSLGGYPWSSHRGYLSQAKRWSWLSKDLILLMLCRQKKLRRKAYLDFMQAQESDTVKRFYSLKNLRSVLGTSAFVQWVKDSFSDVAAHKEVPESSWLKLSIEEIIEHVSQASKIPSEDLIRAQRGRSHPERDMAIYLANRYSRETMTALAGAFGLSRHGSIGSAVKRVEDAMKEERDFRTKLKKMEKRLKESVNKGKEPTIGLG
jgi:hypothetical protein